MSAAPAPRGAPVHVTPSGLRFLLLTGDADQEELEVLGAALDRLVALERGGAPSPWTRGARPGAGARAWLPGNRWSHSVRAEWGREP
jgi:hypothetical protein